MSIGPMIDAANATLNGTTKLAELALRMTTVEQKIGGISNSAGGAEVFATIQSFFSSVAKNAYNIIDAIRAADAFCAFKGPTYP